MATRETLGDRIYAFRVTHCLSQRQMATLLGIGAAAMSRWETSGDKPNDANRAKLELLLATYIPGSNGVTSKKSNGTPSNDELFLAFGKATVAFKRAYDDFETKRVEATRASDAFEDAKDAEFRAETALKNAQDVLSDLEERIASLTQ